MPQSVEPPKDPVVEPPKAAEPPKAVEPPPKAAGPATPRMDPLRKPRPEEPAPPVDDKETLEHLWARMSARLGIVSMGLCMAAPCTFTATYWAALPAAIVTLWLARASFMGSEPGTATRAYAKIGLVTGGAALTFSLVFLLVIASWTAMLMGIIVLDSM